MNVAEDEVLCVTACQSTWTKPASLLPCLLNGLQGVAQQVLMSVCVLFGCNPTFAVIAYLSAAAFAATRATPRNTLEASCSLMGVRKDIQQQCSCCAIINSTPKYKPWSIVASK